MGVDHASALHYLVHEAHDKGLHVGCLYAGKLRNASDFNAKITFESSQRGHSPFTIHLDARSIGAHDIREQKVAGRPANFRQRQPWNTQYS